MNGSLKNVNLWFLMKRLPIKFPEIRKESDSVLEELIEEPYFGRVVTAEEDGGEVSFKIGKKSNIESRHC